MSLKELVKTISKIENLKIESEKIMDKDGVALKIKYNDEDFFVFVKKYIDDLIVLNVVNPISFLGKIKNGIELELANEFNTRAIGAKCILTDQEKKNYLFSREELIRGKDIYNKDLIEVRLKTSISMVISAVSIFEDSIKEEEAGDEQEENK